MMFKDGRYIDSGLSQEERNRLAEQAAEEDNKYKSWDEVPKVTEDQND